MHELYCEWAEIYDSVEGRDSRETWERGILADLVTLGRDGTRILDIGAGTGTGRRSILGMFPGSRVVSLDRSEKMLKAGSIPADSYVIADMSAFRIDDLPFDFVVSGFDALNCLRKDHLVKCFESVSSALKPGGKFIFDYSSRKMLKYDWAGLVIRRELQGQQLLISHSYNPAFDRTDVDIRLESCGKTLWIERHHHYSLDPFTIEETARHSDLAVSYVRDIDRRLFSPMSGTHVYVLEKSG